MLLLRLLLSDDGETLRSSLSSELFCRIKLLFEIMISLSLMLSQLALIYFWVCDTPGLLVMNSWSNSSIFVRLHSSFSSPGWIWNFERMITPELLAGKFPKLLLWWRFEFTYWSMYIANGYWIYCYDICCPIGMGIGLGTLAAAF